MTYFSLTAGNAAVLAGVSTAPSPAFMQCNGVYRAEPSLFLLLSLISVSASGVFDIFDREKNTLNIERSAREYIDVWFSSYCRVQPVFSCPRMGKRGFRHCWKGEAPSLGWLLMKRWQVTPSLHSDLAFSFFCYFGPHLKMS